MTNIMVFDRAVINIWSRMNMSTKKIMQSYKKYDLKIIIYIII